MLPGRDRKSGDIRLVGGRNPWEGRVQVFSSGVWGNVCGWYAFGDDDATVCRQLGYSPHGNVDNTVKPLKNAQIGTWDFNVKKRLSLGD